MNLGLRLLARTWLFRIAAALVVVSNVVLGFDVPKAAVVSVLPELFVVAQNATAVFAILTAAYFSSLGEREDEITWVARSCGFERARMARVRIRGAVAGASALMLIPVVTVIAPGVLWAHEPFGALRLAAGGAVFALAVAATTSLLSGWLATWIDREAFTWSTVILIAPEIAGVFPPFARVAELGLLHAASGLRWAIAAGSIGTREVGFAAELAVPCVLAAIFSQRALRRRRVAS